MQQQLKELNKVLQKNLNSPKGPSPRALGKPKKKTFGLIFEKIIILILTVTILLFLILAISPLNKFLKREITISGPKTIINLEQLSLNSLLQSGKKERVNLLFLGIPGKGYHGEKLTDTIIIINSTSKAEKPIGISIPRDLLVKFPGKDFYTKINALFNAGENEEQGVNLIITKLKEITGLDFDYFIVFNLGGVKNLIDELGGIDVVVKENIYDPQFPGPDDSYQIFSINKGVHHLDGETTLKYIRSRNQAGGDFARIQRQQEVINILKNQILSLNFFWDFPTILNIWKTLNSHTYTDIDLDDIKYVWNLVKKTNLDEIKFSTLDQEFLISDEIILGNEKAYILKPRAGLENYQEIREYINQLVSNL
ncbi:MAG: LCP family protein [Patescibacteria group bacterium]